MAVLVFSGGARLRVDSPPEQVVQAFRDGLSRGGDEWVTLERDGYETWIYTPEIAAVLHDDDRERRQGSDAPRIGEASAVATQCSRSPQSCRVSG